MESELYKDIFGAGRAEGVATGEARGEARGEVRGEARGVLKVLDARGIAVSEALRERILSCTDPAMIDVWTRRAAVASTAASVVRGKTPPRGAKARSARRGRKA